MKILKRLSVVLILALVIVLLTAYKIIGGDAKFGDTYQSVIQRKYDVLKNTKEKKIIIIGGSSAGFGIDEELLEEKTGYKVANMGLHAGFGQLFNTEIARDFIKEGDIVLLGYEYDTIASPCFEHLGDRHLIMTGIDNRLDMYRAIPIKNYPEIFGNLFDYANGKFADRDLSGEGVYASTAFDEKGRMIFPREAYCISDISTFGIIDIVYMQIADENVTYLRKLKKEVEDKKAEVYFIAPPFLKDTFTGSEEDCRNYARNIEEKTGIRYISNPYDYVFDSDYMYDTNYHCNDKGKKKRTEQLCEDLLRYIE